MLSALWGLYSGPHARVASITHPSFIVYYSLIETHVEISAVLKLQKLDRIIAYIPQSNPLHLAPRLHFGYLSIPP